MKKLIAIALAGLVGLGGLILPNVFKNDTLVLKVANWAEYIDEGDENAEDPEMQASLVELFEAWYEEQTGNPIRVEYCIADDNETLYNMIKMGDTFDLTCPSEYMLMKLVQEGYVQKLPASFYDESIEGNYYAQNVSPFIEDLCATNYIGSEPWKDYVAGYMWGTTGFVYNPLLATEEDVTDWKVFLNQNYKGKITAKNNVRDTYFAGLAIHHEEELLSLKTQYEAGAITKETYRSELKRFLNTTDADTMNAVHSILKNLANNLYGFETDEGKAKVLAGELAVNYQWSGDASYVIYTAEYGEDEDNPPENPVYLNYAIPETVSNLWFDGWALMESCQDETIKQAAMMFINFLSRPDNAVRNMNYIGYTSCIASDTVYEDFVLDCFEAEEGDNLVEYDLNYYFNRTSTWSEDYVFYVAKKETKRQLFAQYPREEDLVRCVAMDYFDSDANQRANLMWSDVTFF